MNAIFFIVLVIFITTAYFTDLLNITSRVYGSINNSLAMYTHVGMQIMIVNRAVVSLSLPVIGYYIDLSLSLSYLLLIFACASFTTLLIYAYSVKRADLLFLLIKYVGKVNKYSVDKNEFYLDDIKTESMAIQYPAFFVMMFNMLGFMLPSVFAGIFHEYRATLVQSGFILNSIAMILNIFFVEKGIAVVMTKGNNEHIILLWKELICSKLLGIIVVTFILLILSFIL